jgi:mono/diheme cytochrome c family protein
MRTVVAALVTAAVVGGAALFWVGAYDISATDQHLAPTYWVLDTGMRRSVSARAHRISVPPLDGEPMIARGLAHFQTHCVQCHGAPGIAPEPFALGMTPAPANLVHTGRAWSPAELFWTIKHGIKMTGMPAWKYRLDDDAIWSLVAFMRVLPALSVEDYRRSAERLAKPATSDRPASDAPLLPNAKRGEQAINQHLCATCHAIPGIVGSHAPVGPPLDGIARRQLIAGVLPNTNENMVRWLRAPQDISRGSAMPNLGITEQDARDIAAYLATLR